MVHGYTTISFTAWRCLFHSNMFGTRFGINEARLNIHCPVNIVCVALLVVHSGLKWFTSTDSRPQCPSHWFPTQWTLRSCSCPHLQPKAIGGNSTFPCQVRVNIEQPPVTTHNVVINASTLKREVITLTQDLNRRPDFETLFCCSTTWFRKIASNQLEPGPLNKWDPALPAIPNDALLSVWAHSVQDNLFKL